MHINPPPSSPKVGTGWLGQHALDSVPLLFDWLILCSIIGFEEMDLASSCKEKLAYFRIKELKDVLTQLGLSKQGKKQDLVDRILSMLSDDQVSKMFAKKNAIGKEQVAKLVDDTYRKMQISGATDLSSKGQGASDSSNVKIKGEKDDSFQSDTKIRCICRSTLDTDPLVKV
ncbi:SUMO ligase siz1 [Stylosanthes scabra]|uniref:SUMO ligase siz1 n=1 Tax=Stylosanthes scabra TaxID=79078 RepID=A0ABU6ZGH5_9FABA|nr:SUMO ligase siz1 [Stylosanthes scabra]